MAIKTKPMFWIYGNRWDSKKVFKRICLMLENPKIESYECGFSPQGENTVATARDIILALKNPDLFDRRSRIIKMIGLSEDFALIVDYLHLVSDRNLLVIYGPPGYRKHGSNRWVPATTTTLYKTFKKEGKVFEFPEEAKTELEAVKWLEGYVGESGRAIDKEVLQHLVERRGRNLDVLCQEIGKVALYKSKGKITVEDINECCLSNFQDTIWQFIDALDTLDFESASNYLENLFRTSDDQPSAFKGETESLFAAIRHHYQLGMCFKDIGQLDAGKVYERLADMVKLTPKDIFALSKGFGKLEELEPLYKQGSISYLAGQKGMRSVFAWRGRKIYQVVTELTRCQLLCRMYGADLAFVRACLNGLVGFICDKLPQRALWAIMGYPQARPIAV